jgi:hypothetical protein
LFYPIWKIEDTPTHSLTKIDSKMKQEKLKQVFVLLAIMALTFNSSAQSFENLNHLPGHHLKTYYSDGSMAQAENMANRCDRVMSFYASILQFEPSVTLLVLSPADWTKYTEFPVYGMPHYDDAQILIVASEDNDFWKSFIPAMEKLPSDLAKEISTTYASKDGELTMRDFFDLLAIHELGHAFHIQGGLKMQRKWMGELFANIFLHTYIAEKESDLLPALTVFPKMVVSSINKEDLKFTTLEELESNYGLLGQQFPQNYGWYQCRWHMAAGDIYDAGGIKAFNALWYELQKEKEQLDDAAFLLLLSTKVDQSVANVPLNWNE